MMRAVLIILGIVLACLQYYFWTADSGILKVFHLNNIIKEQQLKNDETEKQNQALMHEIEMLKKGDSAIENRARSDLGMIKKGEKFYQLVK